MASVLSNQKKRIFVVIALFFIALTLRGALSVHTFNTGLTVKVGGIAPLNGSIFVVPWYDVGNSKFYFDIYDTAGTNITTTTLIDTITSTSWNWMLDAAAFNSTHFVIVWYDGVEDDVTYAIYNITGGVIKAATDVDTTAGAGSIAQVATLNSSVFAVAWLDEMVADDNVTIAVYNTKGTQILAPTYIATSATQIGGISISAVNSTDFVVAWVNNSDNGAYFRTYDVDGNSRTLGQIDSSLNQDVSLQIAVYNDTHFAYTIIDTTDDDLTIGSCPINGGSCSPYEIDTNVGQSDVTDVAALNSTNYVGVYPDFNANISYYIIWHGEGIPWPSYVRDTTVSGISATSFESISVASENHATGIGICDNNYVLFHQTDQTSMYWGTYTAEGVAWDGVCINQRPFLTTPTLAPVPAYTNSNLTANVTFTSEDDDIVNLTFTWYVNSAIVYVQNFTDQSNNTVVSSLLNLTFFSKTNLVNVTVDAIDSSGDRAETNLTSSTLTISNFVPTFSSAVITPDPAVNESNLTCSNSTVLDWDGDSITVEYLWFKNAVRTSETEQILGMGNTSVGDNWYCEINVTDGTNYSGAVTSQTVVIGSATTAPTLNSTTATTAYTGVTSNTANPTNSNSWANLSVLFHDDNSGDTWTAYFCKTNVFNGYVCAGGYFCKSTSNSTDNPLTCKYLVENETAQSRSYYAYVVDNGTLYQGSGSGKAGTFSINHRPPRPTISTPTNNTWITIDSSIIRWAAVDPDGDNITWYIYADNTSDPTTLANVTAGAAFNWTGLNETTYYIKVLANDTHGYLSSLNSTVAIVKVDTISPTVHQLWLSSSEVIAGSTTTVYMNCSDSGSGVNTAINSYNITTPLSAVTTKILTLSSGLYSDDYTTSTAGTYTIDVFRCYDLAGNMAENASVLTFTASTAGGGGTAAGSAGAPSSYYVAPIDEEEPAVCGNEVCENGESPANCPADCFPDFDRLITCIWDPNIKCLYTETWFVTFLVIIIVGTVVVIEFQSTSKKRWI